MKKKTIRELIEEVIDREKELKHLVFQAIQYAQEAKDNTDIIINILVPPKPGVAVSVSIEFQQGE